MRDLRCDQLPLSAAPNEEEHIGARQLAEIDRALVPLPDDGAIAMVYSDRDTFYGHKVCLTVGASQLVLDVVVQEGNPPDSKLAVNMMQRQEQLYGRPPRQAAFDGGFASRKNLEDLKELGVKDVAFSKGRGLSVTEMTSSERVYRRLRNFRAGVESVISSLKRVFGWDRCTWRGFESFKAYTWASVLSYNLLVITRRAMATSS